MDRPTYTCKRCGKPTGNYTTFSHATAVLLGEAGVSICDECREKRRARRDWQNEHCETEYITCPWCGYEEHDSWEFAYDSDDAHEYPECGKVFEWERQIEITYMSRRRMCDFHGLVRDGGAGDE